MQILQLILTALRDPAMTTIIALAGIPLSIWLTRQQSKSDRLSIHHHF